MPGLELPPTTHAGLAFSATGNWLLVTVNEGDYGELLAWRPGMPGPVLVTTLPGPLAGAAAAACGVAPAAQRPARPVSGPVRPAGVREADRAGTRRGRVPDEKIVPDGPGPTSGLHAGITLGEPVTPECDRLPVPP